MKIRMLWAGIFWPLFCEMVIATTVNVAISSYPNNLIPFYSTDANSQFINQLVHQSLVVFNDQMQVECQLCERYEEKIINQKHVITFYLKSNLSFSRGVFFEAKDVENSWKYFVKDELIQSAFKASLSSLEKVEILNKHIVRLIYHHYSIENLANLPSLKIVKMTKNNLKEIEGLGEYILGEITPLSVELIPKKKLRNKLKFIVVKDETTLALKILNKEIDLSTAQMTARKMIWLTKEMPELQVWQKESGNYLYLGVNFKNLILAKKDVRRALSLLIPRKKIEKYKLKSTAILSTGMFSSAFVDMKSGRVVDEYNPELAKEILRKNGIKSLNLEWIVNNNKSTIEISEIIKESFAEANIKLEIRILEWGSFMNHFKKGEFDVVMAQWVGFTGPDMLRFVYHSKMIPPNGGNRISYQNISFDEMMNLAEEEVDQKRRNELYNNAYKFINDDYASIPLWHPNIVWIGSRCLKNVRLHPAGGFNYLALMEKNCGK